MMLRGPRGLRALHEDESGQAMVEFVLVFPIQLLLSLSILQFCFLAHAYLTCQHAAFMGARAAAVADDGLMPGLNQTEAATRVVARLVSPLTSGEPGAGGNVIAPLRWKAEGGGIGVLPPREQEAYGNLEVRVQHEKEKGYVACAVTYDYILQIPVANHFIAQLGGGGSHFWYGERGAYNAASQARGKTAWRIERVGFISTPWTKPMEGR